MATALHTFTDIFNTEIEYQGEVISLKKIAIYLSLLNPHLPLKSPKRSWINHGSR